MKNSPNKAHLTSLIFVFLLMACGQASGPQTSNPTNTAQPPPAGIEVLPPRNAINNERIENLDLQLLLTDFYASGLEQGEDYGYYIYLVFADNQPATYEKRLMAASAFMCSFTSVHSEDVRDIAKQNIALFLAPMASSQYLDEMRQASYPDILLQLYSYIEGQLFQYKAFPIKAFESIAIIGSPTKLNPRADAPFPDNLEVLDLSAFSPLEIAETIVGLRKVVLSRNIQGSTQDSAGSLPQFASLQQPRFELRLAAFFEAVGQGVISLAAISQAVADDRECQ